MQVIKFSMFRDKIEDGRKTHTIRFKPVVPEIGELVTLAWVSREGGDVIGEAICTQIDGITINSVEKSVRVNGEILMIEATEKLAIDDGFDDLADFWAFFTNSEFPSRTGSIIHWGDLRLEGGI
jgi:hypothetical protein